MTEPVGVVRHRVGAVLVIRFNDPDNLNSMSEHMRAGLSDALAEAKASDVRAVVLTGTGRAFTAGGDVRTMAKTLATPDSARRRMQSAYESLVIPLHELDKPVIAAVNGVTAGAGIAFALGCDVRLAARSASFVFAFNKLGLVPDSAVAFMLPRLVGLSRAKEIAFMRQRLSADQAHAWGLVSDVVDDDVLMESALELATRLAAGPTIAIGLTKQLLDASLDHSLRSFLELEGAYQAIASQTRDHVAAREAFLTKSGEVDFEGR